MTLFRPMAALLLAILVMESAVIFHWYDMQSAVPKIRTLMPQGPADANATTATGADDNATREARDLCFSDQPVWQGDKSQMDYCMVSAAAGDPRAQQLVAQFYLNGETSASQATGLFWLRAAARNQRNPSLADLAKLKFVALTRSLDHETLARAKTIPGWE